jgi:hypothetical protein
MRFLGRPSTYIALMLVLVIMVGAGNLWATYTVNNKTQMQFTEQQERQDVLAAQERAAQKAQSEAVERKLCTSFGRMASLHPPSGSVSSNPSGAYDQALHEILTSLGTDIGCQARS